MTTLTRTITEAAFQAVVLEVAHRGRWFAYHTFDSRRSTPGFPDLVLLRAPEAIFAELKSESGKVSPAQAHVLEQLEDCGFEVHVWRPSQLDEIIARLTTRRP